MVETNKPENGTVVRAIYRAAVIPKLEPPYNVAHLKIFYPGNFTGSDLEHNTGQVAVRNTHKPMPIVILMPGINLGSNAYQWLAENLCKNGMVVVTYNLIAEEMPGYVSVTPGLDLDFIRPSSYRSGPSANTIHPILEVLANLSEEGLLQGKLDLDCVTLGGHSAGGTAALLNANPDWFPSVKGIFSFGAHSGASTALGFPENTNLDIDNRLPILMLGGTNDGCIAASQNRYGGEFQDNHVNLCTARLEETFEYSIEGGGQDKLLILIDGANHFSIAHPVDQTAGRSFIDLPTTRPDNAIRECLSDLIAGFIAQFITKQSPSDAYFDSALEKHDSLVFLERRK